MSDQAESKAIRTVLGIFVGAALIALAFIIGIDLPLQEEVDAVRHEKPAAVTDPALEKARPIIQKHEGLKLKAYRDAAGYPTIGYGHKLSNTRVYENIDLSKIWPDITEAKANELLTQDMAEALKAVDDYVNISLPAWRYQQRLDSARMHMRSRDRRKRWAVQKKFNIEIDKTLSVNQRAALTDFVFNVGASAFHHSTLLKYINTDSLVAVPGELSRWIYAGGHVQQGLVNRRKDEVELWNTPD